MEQHLHGDLSGIQEWEVAATASDVTGLEFETIARIELVKGHLEHADLWSQLDAVSADLAWVGGALLGTEGDLRGDLAEAMNALGMHLLILNHVDLAEKWRGYGVGAYLVGEALLAMATDAHCVATIPAPTGSLKQRSRAHAVRKLERVWAQLGFEHYRDGAWVLDPGSTVLRDAVARMRANFAVDERQR